MTRHLPFRLVHLLVLSVFACMQVHCLDASPCQPGALLPHAFPPGGYACQTECDCNTQSHHGTCIQGRCKVLAVRQPCPVASQRLEANRSNVLFDELCPGLTQTQLAQCPSGTFAKQCTNSHVWTNCTCVGTSCQGESQLCQTECSKGQPCACYDLQRDPAHCGQCHRACPQGYTCQKGACHCPRQRTECSQPVSTPGQAPIVKCVSLQDDRQHCGACGKTCSQGTLCRQGRCQEVHIQPGTFTRGTPDTELNWQAYTAAYHTPPERETPHLVTLTRPFSMGRYEVTRGWYRQVMGSLPNQPSTCIGDNDHCPVQNVTLQQAMHFCNKLSKATGLELCYQCQTDTTGNTICQAAPAFAGKAIYNCKGYRLPTDAEWEYAARAGHQRPFPGGPTVRLPLSPKASYADNLVPFAWYRDNAKDALHAVGTKRANDFGLSDMHGNVAEWVWQPAKTFQRTTLLDPIASTTGHQLTRGGHIHSVPLQLRVAARTLVSGAVSDAKNRRLVGFRIARTLPHDALCPKSGLAACGVYGCIDTLRNEAHCGRCNKACTSFEVCRQGTCLRPEVLVQTRAGDDTPFSWTMGHNMKTSYDLDNCLFSGPAHQVALSHAFYASQFEVQQREFAQLLGFNPSHFPCPTCPVESVTWFQALAYANALSKQMGLETCYVCDGDIRHKNLHHCHLKPAFWGRTGKEYYKCKGYRLPTEAEWEYMARAGGRRKTFCHHAESQKAGYNWLAWEQYRGFYAETRTNRPVGQSRPFGFGISDLFDSVSEWVWDIYHPTLGLSPQVYQQTTLDPTGPQQTTLDHCWKCPAKPTASGTPCASCYRVFRGGDFRYHCGSADEAVRYKSHVTRINDITEHPRCEGKYIGFRLVRTYVPPKGASTP